MVARSDQSPVRLEQPPKTQATTQHLDPNGFCERDERKEEVWSLWVASLVGGIGLWVAPMGFGRDGMVGERRNGWW